MYLITKYRYIFSICSVLRNLSYENDRVHTHCRRVKSAVIVEKLRLYKILSRSGPIHDSVNESRGFHIYEQVLRFDEKLLVFNLTECRLFVRLNIIFGLGVTANVQ